MRALGLKANLLTLQLWRLLHLKKPTCSLTVQVKGIAGAASRHAELYGVPRIMSRTTL